MGHLPDNIIVRLADLLPRLAKSASFGFREGQPLTDRQIADLFCSHNLECQQSHLQEVREWINCLEPVFLRPATNCRLSAIIDLTSRGIPEENALAAVHITARYKMDSPAADIKVPGYLNIENVEANQKAQGSIKVISKVGGRVEPLPDDVRVSPETFGPGEAVLDVEIDPPARPTEAETVRLIVLSNPNSWVNLLLRASWRGSRTTLTGDGHTISDGLSLRCVYGNLPGRIYPLNKKYMLVGRHPEKGDFVPDIDLFDQEESQFKNTVSRRHLAVVYSAGCYKVIDLESLNGSQLNDDVLQPGRAYFLEEGDELSIGMIKFIAQAM